VNGLRKIAEYDDLAETRDPMTGMLPDSQRILRAVLETRGIGAELSARL
jgi:hypothetical protein